LISQAVVMERIVAESFRASPLASALANWLPIIARRAALIYNPGLPSHGVHAHKGRCLSSFKHIAVRESEHEKNTDQEANAKTNKELLQFHCVGRLAAAL